MPFSDPGAIADVSSGGVVDPDWGNAIRDRVIHHFANAAARNAAITAPTEGMACWLADVNQLQVYDGSAWRIITPGAWVAWTPTWANASVGNGTVVAKYSRVGQTINFSVQLTFGSTTSFSNTPSFNLPAAAASDRDQAAYGLAQDLSASSKRYGLAAKLSGTDMAVSTDVAGAVNVSGTGPFTWATGDIYWIQGTYEAA